MEYEYFNPKNYYPAKDKVHEMVMVERISYNYMIAELKKLREEIAKLKERNTELEEENKELNELVDWTIKNDERIQKN